MFMFAAQEVLMFARSVPMKHDKAQVRYGGYMEVVMRCPYPNGDLARVAITFRRRKARSTGVYVHKYLPSCPTKQATWQDVLLFVP